MLLDCNAQDQDPRVPVWRWKSVLKTEVRLNTCFYLEDHRTKGHQSLSLQGTNTDTTTAVPRETNVLQDNRETFLVTHDLL